VATRPRGRPVSDDAVTTDALLDRALEMFADRGYDAMSVRELARGLGVSHNLIPQRIGSKEQLWFAAIDRGFNALAAALAQVLTEQDDHTDDAQRLRALLVTFIEANATRPALLRIVNQEAIAPGPRLDHIFTNFIEPVRQFGEDLLNRLEADGTVRTRSIGPFYFLLTHGAGGAFALPALAQRLGASPDPSDPVAVRKYAEEVGGLLADGLFLP
jgi:TetR/AcrR family transcriptional regulator